MKEKYKKNTVGSLMITDFFTSYLDKTIKQIVADLYRKEVRYSFMDYGYILNKSNNLIGVFSIGDLFRYPPSTPIKKIVKRNPVSVSPNSRDEVAAHIALRSKVKALPVVEKGKIIGVIPSKKILNIIHRSAQEDFMHMAGVSKSRLDYEDTMKVPIYKSVWHRAPWLLIGLAGIMLAAGFIGMFEKALEEYIILASFIPAILYLSGALASQNVTVCVRDIAAYGREFSRLKYFARQTIIAFFLGIIISGVTYLVITLFWHETHIGPVIAIALFLAAIITNFTSLGTTLIIERLGKDPAYGSGPFATILSDVTAIVIYLVVASSLLF